MADDKKEPDTAEEGAGCGVCMIKPWTKQGLVGAANYDYKYLCMPS